MYLNEFVERLIAGWGSIMSSPKTVHRLRWDSRLAAGPDGEGNDETWFLERYGEVFWMKE